MAEKELKVRVQLKADTSTNWAKATNFIPKKGEVCFYTDLKNFKVGDGTTKINSDSLGFYNTAYSAFGGATASAAGSAGLVPAPAAADNHKLMMGNARWTSITGGTGISITYDDANRSMKISCSYPEYTGGSTQL